MAESLEVAQLYASIGIRGLDQTRGNINSLQSQLRGVKTILKSLVGVAIIRQIGSQFLEAAKSAETYRMSLRAVASSVEVADAAFKRMRDWAALNPVDTDEAIGSYVRLTTAAVADAERATKIIANLSTAMNKDMRDVASAIVTTKVEALRQLGIILDRTGKTAIMSFGRVTIETDKSIRSIRAGLINLIEQSVGTALEKAGNTFRGTVKTMLGMFDIFKQQVMGLDDGPFVQLTTSLRGARDALGQFMQTADYAALVANFQSLAGVVVQLATTGIGALVSALKFAYDHANLLAAAFVAFTSAKTILAIAAVIAQLKKMGIVLAVINALSGPAGWLALAAAAVAGTVAYYKVTKAMSENAEQAKITTEATERLKKKFEGASEAVIRASYNMAAGSLIMLTKELQFATMEAQRLQYAIKDEVLDMSAKGKLLKQLQDVEAQVNRVTVAMKLTRAEKNALLGLLKDDKEKPLPIQEPIRPSGSGKKEKTAAEKLVEHMRDQIKYMGVDGAFFTGELEKWIAKTKILSSDWKLLVDLYREIKAEGEEDMILRAKGERQRREDAAAADEATKQMIASSQSAWLTMQQWGVDSGMVTKETYMATLGAEFEKLRTQLGLTMDDFAKWPPYVRDLFMAIQTGVMEEVTPKLELLHDQFTNGAISLGAYKAALNAIMEEYSNVPLVVNAIGEALKTSSVSIMSFNEALIASLTDATKSFNELATVTIEGVANGFANAIASGKSFGESLAALGQEIVFTIAKMMILKALTGAMNMFGFAKGGIVEAGPNLGTSSYGESYGGAFMGSLLANAKGNVFGPGGLARFADGGIVTKPTLFKFAKGLGLMGEAGPEAIVPLERGSGGKLGVRSSGGSAPVIINVLDKDDLEQVTYEAMSKYPGSQIVTNHVMRQRSERGSLAFGGATR